MLLGAILAIFIIIPFHNALANDPGPIVSLHGQWDMLDNKNDISWNPLHSEDIGQISVERSIGDTHSFEEVGSSISNGSASYSDQALQGDGIYYYRLKVTDQEGGVNFSDILAVEVGLNDEFEVISIPNHQLNEHIFRINLGKSSVVGFGLFDQEGQRLKSWRSKVLKAGKHDTVIHMDDIPSGKYLFKISIDHQVHNQLLVKY